VIERAASIDDVGAGLVLYPNGVAALDAISPHLGRQVRACGHVALPGGTRPLVSPDGVVRSVDDPGRLGERFGTPQVSLLRSALQSVLLAEARAAGVVVAGGLTVLDHVDHGDRVTATLTGGTTITADLLVGADGLHSGVRRRLFGDEPPRYRGYTTLRGRTPAPAAYPLGVVVAGDAVGLFAAPIGGGRLYWTAKLAAPAGSWPAKRVDEALADLLDLIAGWHPNLVGLVRGTTGDRTVAVTDIWDRDPTPVWSRNRVTLLGDAAHPMSPGLGQGAGMAIEDAAVLSAVLRDGTGPEAFARYEWLRAPRTARAVELSRLRDTVVGGGPTREFSTHDEQLADLFGWRAQPLPSRVRSPR